QSAERRCESYRRESAAAPRRPSYGRDWRARRPGHDLISGSERRAMTGPLVTAAGSDRIEVVNPATEEVFASVPAGTGADVDRAVAAARQAQPSWAQVPVGERPVTGRCASRCDFRGQNAQGTGSAPPGGPGGALRLLSPVSQEGSPLPQGSVKEFDVNTRTGTIVSDDGADRKSVV